MALKINIPDSAWSTQSLSLGGQDYEFEFKYNGREDRWRLSIGQGDTSIVSGVKIIENRLLFLSYRLPLFAHGDLICLRTLQDNKQVGRDNFAIDKPYELLYYSYTELDELVNG